MNLITKDLLTNSKHLFRSFSLSMQNTTFDDKEEDSTKNKEKENIMSESEREYN